MAHWGAAMAKRWEEFGTNFINRAPDELDAGFRVQNSVKICDNFVQLRFVFFKSGPVIELLDKLLKLLDFLFFRLHLKQFLRSSYRC